MSVTDQRSSWAAVRRDEGEPERRDVWAPKTEWRGFDPLLTRTLGEPASRTDPANKPRKRPASAGLLPPDASRRSPAQLNVRGSQAISRPLT